MNHDFLVFQLKLLSSLSPNVPLEANLCALMAPALGKIRGACGAAVAIHVFTNPDISESHALVVGGCAETSAALRKEMNRRHRPPSDSESLPERSLPSYRRITGAASKVFKRDASDEYSQPCGERLVQLLTPLFDERPSEWASKPQRSDIVIVIPLGAKPYFRLGFVVLWSPGAALVSAASDPGLWETRVGFRSALEQLMVRVFTNFYRMEPHTYLPSFCQPTAKNVTLLCAEIWNFPKIVEIIRRRDDLDHDGKIMCLRSLVNRFTKTTADVVESHRGRTDQIWGSGLLAVFGEYLDTVEISPRAGCKRAVTAAAHLVTAVRRELQDWLANEFNVARYRSLHAEEIKVAPVVAIDHGEVILDYIGSEKQRVYMTVGDRVAFVRTLASLAGTGRFIPGGATSVRDSYPRSALEPGMSEGAPILLSQSAHEWATDVLRDRAGQHTGEVNAGQTIRELGLDRDYVVYPIYPENVVTSAEV